MAYPITVVGVGPGPGEYLTPAAERAVREADLLVGGRRALGMFPEDGKERCLIGSDLEAVLDYIDAAREEKRVAVLLSGDPGFFSLLPRLRDRFGPENLRVIPGISSMQLAFARLGMSWHDFWFVSVHGRDIEVLAAACGRERVAVLTGPQCTPGAVCRYFLDKGCSFDQVFVLTDLGLPGEEVTETSLEQAARLDGRGNSIVVLLANRRRAFGEGFEETERAPGPREWSEVITPGLPDEAFLRGDAAMSQEEVRALVLSKARLCRGMSVIEVGAGTGSWTVEAARLVAPGRVWAVEKNASAAAFVRANIERFGLDNVVLVEGEAPSACSGFPKADRLLIGGTGGKLEDVLKAAGEWLVPGGLVVVTAVTPET
ncbi:MAG: precorrin-6y C5,15-methyltransferase (decarboxylating) subunit CbiE, partial [Thermacetogeniaceae bacterium]